MLYILALLLSLTTLVAGVIKLKVHPFLALLLTAILYGFLTGMKVDTIIESINSGFGDLLGKIGLIILFGVTIGTFLEKSGGALVVANRVLKIIGEKSIYLAMLLTGYFLSIPIFADSALLIMNPLTKVLSKKAAVSYAGSIAALAMGLTAAHVMVPPTPGPIAAAGILGANLGNVIVLGLLVSLTSLIPCYFYASKVVSKIRLDFKIEPIQNKAGQPQVWKSLLAIIIPLFLILLKSVLDYPSIGMAPSLMTQTIAFIGTPSIALLIGVFLSFLLPEKLDTKILSSSGWVGASFKTAAPIILITGAGGIFGRTIENSGITAEITESFAGTDLGIFFPFLLAASLKTIQGSSTIALVTAASIVKPLIFVLGLNEPTMLTLTVLAIGAGSSVVSHVNDSFFWVLTQLTSMNIKQGYFVQTAGTGIFGFSSMALIYLLTKVLA